MRKLFLFLSMLIAASFALTSCEQPAGNTNKAANTGVNANTSSASTANNEADVKKMMGDIAAALAKNDADALDKFYADDYINVTRAGVLLTKAQRLADLRSGATKYESFTYEDISVRSYGDTAVANALINAKGKVQGQDLAQKARSTLVFVKMKDGWKVVNGQATPITGQGTTATSSNTASANTAANANKPPAAPTANKY